MFCIGNHGKVVFPFRILGYPVITWLWDGSVVGCSGGVLVGVCVCVCTCHTPCDSTGFPFSDLWSYLSGMLLWRLLGGTVRGRVACVCIRMADRMRFLDPDGPEFESQVDYCWAVYDMAKVGQRRLLEWKFKVAPILRWWPCICTTLRISASLKFTLECLSSLTLAWPQGITHLSGSIASVIWGQ